MKVKSTSAAGSKDCGRYNVQAYITPPEINTPPINKVWPTTLAELPVISYVCVVCVLCVWCVRGVCVVCVFVVCGVVCMCVVCV